MKCLKCAIKNNIKTVENVFRMVKCKDCVHGITPCKCDNCDEILVYCTIMRYTHDGNTTNNCIWFKAKDSGGEKTVV